MRLSEVARRAGVGYGTASRALSGNGSVDPETRARVLAAARELGYRPNAAARALREKRTRTVGLLVPDIVNDFYTESAAVLQTALDAAGYQLVVAATADDPDRERRALAALLDRGIDALVHVPVAARLDLPPELPVVELNRRSTRRRAAVIADDVGGVAELAASLVDLGYRDFGVVTGPRAHSTGRDRRAGFERAAAGIDARVIEVPFSVEGGADAVRRLLDDPPEIILALGTRLVVGALRAASERGVRIPDDVALTGYGDPDWFGVWNTGITTFAPPLAEMGARTADVLLGWLAEGTPPAPRVVRLPGRVVLRGSTPGPAARQP